MVHGIGRRPLKPWMYFEYPEFKALHSSRDILGLSQAAAPLNTKYPRILGTFRDCSSYGRASFIHSEYEIGDNLYPCATPCSTLN